MDNHPSPDSVDGYNWIKEILESNNSGKNC